MIEVIVRMEKVPKNCDDSCWGELSGECPWSDHVDGYTMDGGRPRNCPIIGELPEKHGRLIDASTVLFAVEAGEGVIPVTVDDYLETCDVPTIVPATERNET